MKKLGGIFFSDVYYGIEANAEDDQITLTREKDGEITVFNVGGAERKLLFTNPDTTQQMTAITLFNEAEIEGYEFLAFTVTDITGEYEVEEWCEIEPLKAHSGQFVISMPGTGALYARKVYRSAGAVKPSTNVYAIGTTTENRDYCIIKTVEAVKGVQ